MQNRKVLQSAYTGEIKKIITEILKYLLMNKNDNIIQHILWVLDVRLKLEKEGLTNNSLGI